MAAMDRPGLATTVEALNERLAFLEEVVWSLARHQDHGLVRARPDKADPAQAGAVPIGDGAASSKDPRRPLQTDGRGPWPPADQPLPEGWEELPLDDQGRPQQPAWDPWSPEIPPSGKVLTYDAGSGLFRIECGGVRYELRWSDLEPKPPQSLPPPPTEPSRDAESVWLTIRPRLLSRRFFFRQAHCKTQITCVAEYEVRHELYQPRTIDVEGRVIEWITDRHNTGMYRTTRRRTSDFTCPQQG